MDADVVELTDFPELSHARSLWGRGQRPEALQAFRAAVVAKPRNLKALLETARALGAAFKVAEAERLLAQAEAVARGDPALVPKIAQAHAHIHREERAVSLLESIQSRTPSAMAELARLLERSGRLAEARAEIEGCCVAVPRSAEPRLARARILRRLGERDLARSALTALTDPRLPDAIRAEAWTEISYLADREGEPDAAASAIGTAHAILRKQPGTERMIAQARANNRMVTAMSRDLDAATLRRWRGETPGSGRVAHLLGFPRSGTTLLEQWLDAHPDLVASPERAHFTANILPQLVSAGGGLGVAALDRVQARTIVTAQARYCEGMSEALGLPIGARLHLDKNPNHTGLIPALLRLFPDASFVVALRDPRDVVTSCVLRSFRLTEFSAMLLDWSTAVELYVAEMSAWLRLRTVIPAHQWVETRYEDMVGDPHAEVTRVLEGLGLSWHPDVAEWQARTQGKFVNSPTQTEARLPVYGHAVGRWRAYRRYLEPHLDRLAPLVEALGYPRD